MYSKMWFMRTGRISYRTGILYTALISGQINLCKTVLQLKQKLLHAVTQNNNMIKHPGLLMLLIKLAQWQIVLF